jgi:RHS repeat-associated protein
LKRYGYAYDGVGNRTTEQVDDAAIQGSFSNMNRLTSRQPGGALTFAGSTSEAASVTVQSKPATTTSGNAFSGAAEVGGGTSTVTVVATDAANNVRTNDYQVSISGGTTNYTYDANGNVTQKADGTDTWTFDWYADDMLAKVSKNSVEQARFVYDGFGRRYQKIAGGNTTTYTYDGDDILREASTSGTTYSYIHGPGADELLARKDQSAAVVFYAADHLGSIVKTTNTSGAVVTTRRYDPFGNAVQGASEGGFAFTGREWDVEANLYYYRARFYDAGTGRFLSEDPIGFSGGTNFYGYVDNQPTLATDPSGLAAWLRCDKINPKDWPGWKGFGLSLVQGMRGGKPSLHCFIEVECAGRYRVTMELKGPRPRNPNGFSLMRSTLGKPRTSDTTSDITPCPPGGPGGGGGGTGGSNECCAFEDRLINQLGPATSGRGRYNPATNNSNTFVAKMILGAGGSATFPTGAQGGMNSICKP